MKPLRFNEADADRASKAWGANCGPGALAAVTGMTLDEVRPHLIGFDAKRYTNPTMMLAALRSLSIANIVRHRDEWPRFGLARIQWHGPWTKPGVPPRVTYRYTHWVGTELGNNSRGVFDINAMNSGGWISLHDWTGALVPWLLKELHPKADGKWSITHSVEVVT